MQCPRFGHPGSAGQPARASNVLHGLEDNGRTAKRQPLLASRKPSLIVSAAMSMDGMSMDLTLPSVIVVCSAVISFVCAGAGAYFGSYLKKKGENLATHEDIDQVLQDLRAVTSTTKEIEAKISSDLWDRQKQWEIKRDLLLSAAKKLSELENQLLAIYVFWKQLPDIKDENVRIPLQDKRVTGWQDCIHSFEEIESMTYVTCSKETMYAFAELGDLLRKTAANIVRGDLETYRKGKDERLEKFGHARAAIRKELGLTFDLKISNQG